MAHVLNILSLGFEKCLKMSVEKEVIRAIGSDLGETKMDCEHLKRSMNETSVSFFIHEINTWNLSSITKTSFYQYSMRILDE